MGTSLLDEDYPSRQGMVTARQDTRGYADKEDYDLVIIDTAGHDNVVMRAALKHINLGLVPAGHTRLDLNATRGICRVAHEAGVPAPVVLNRVHREESKRTRWYIDKYAADGRILPGCILSGVQRTTPTRMAWGRWNTSRGIRRPKPLPACIPM
ncbi:hypothetical protein [Pelagibacterium sediminicola]|uniref:hypothetical protein n=1 Tax=Pelagibacterium sediminicola TaxID=2248761 RepID=UPI000E3168FC|nr:hypothetical protein [Pelagibacterium sediminicola]